MADKEYCEKCGKLVPTHQLIDDMCDHCWTKWTKESEEAGEKQ